MSTEKPATFALDASFIDGVKPNPGGVRPRLPPGHFRFRVASIAQKASDANPAMNKAAHVMMQVGATVVKRIDGDTADAGHVVESLYGGSKESPKFMLERLAQFLASVSYKPINGQIEAKDLIGREFDATCYWELSKSGGVDPATGQAKQRYVNDRICAERPCGAEAPKGHDPSTMSKEALRYEGAGAEDGEAPPWQGQTTAPPPGGTPQGTPITGPKFIADSELGDEEKGPVAVFRMKWQLRADAAAKAAMIEGEINPDGPVDVAAAQAAADGEADATRKAAALEIIGAWRVEKLGEKPPTKRRAKALNA